MRIIALSLCLLAASTAAHAQNWTSQTYGNQTFTNGMTQDGTSWSATTQRFGGQTFTNYSDSNGQSGTCISSSYGGQTFTHC